MHEQSTVKYSFSTYACYAPDGLFWLNLYEVLCIHMINAICISKLPIRMVYPKTIRSVCTECHNLIRTYTWKVRTKKITNESLEAYHILLPLLAASTASFPIAYRLGNLWSAFWLFSTVFSRFCSRFYEKRSDAKKKSRQSTSLGLIPPVDES